MVKKFAEPEECKITWRAHNYITITDKEQAEKLLRLVDTLEDSDDVQHVSGNYEISPEILKQLT